MGMRLRRALLAVTALAALALGAFWPAGEGDAGPSGQTVAPGDFDFYVLSLSWSPSYCAAEGKGADRQQCGAARPYAFIVHGLWPQNERGYRQDCRTDRPKVPAATARSLYDIMPSAGLIGHEWRTHGACTGLSQQRYFRTLRSAWEKVTIPQQFRRLDRYREIPPGEVEAAFLRANPGLPASAVAVTCDRRYLREVRLCMTRDLRFRGCPRVDRKACRRPSLVMPPARGG